MVAKELILLSGLILFYFIGKKEKIIQESKAVLEENSPSDK